MWLLPCFDDTHSCQTVGKSCINLVLSGITQLLVRASDAGSSPRWAESNITVHILRNTPPSFNNRTVTIPELRVNQTTVNYTVSAVDPDTISEFRVTNYRLDGDSTATRFFQVSNNVETDGNVTGASITITDGAGLTDDNNTEYRLEVVVEDGAGESARQTLLLPFRRNVYPPTFLGPSSVTITVNETQQLDVPILTVSVTDRDLQAPNNHVECFLEGDAETLAYFKVAKNGVNTCDISVRSPLYSDFNRKPQYNLQIVARDGGSTPQTAAVNLTVNVNRNQNTPQFINVDSYPRTIDENMLVGISVTQVTATDEDRVAYGTVSYSLIGDGPSPDYFTVDSAGRITLTSSLAGTEQDYFELRVRASDDGTPSLFNETVVRITINRNLHDPQWIDTIYEVNILSTQNLSVPIIALGASDADTTAPNNQTVFFAVNPTDSALNWFQFDQNGDISVRLPLYDNTNRDQRFEWQMGIRDGGNPPREQATRATVVVNVVYNLNAPIFTGCTPQPRITLREDIASGINAYTATVSDSDVQSPFNSVSLRIIGDDRAPGLFRLDPNPGYPTQRLVIVNGSLAQDNVTEYTVRILAQDGGRPSQSATCVVTFEINRNLNNPSFTDSSYSATVSECVPFDTPVVNVSATDSDRVAPFNDLTFEMNHPYFYVWTQGAGVGIIHVRRDLRTDTTNQTTYTFPVTVRDGGGFSSTVSATVSVRRNLNTPEFTDVGSTGFSLTVDDNLSTGTSVYDADATDGDAGTGTEAEFFSLVYSLVGDGTALPYFTMDDATGLITTRQSIREIDTNFTLQMQVRDNGCPARWSPIKTLTVNVNRNPNRPEFTTALYAATISEEALYGSSVVTVSATDGDALAPYNTVVYELVTPNNQFALNNQSGEISVKTDLTSETSTSFTFDVRAVDGAGQTSTATAEVMVNIIRNNNDPVFPDTNCTVSLFPNATVGSDVLTVTATDADPDTIGTTGNPVT
ncbi:cadherin EGF LAG seven-pass G-type receptor 2-like [Littorina saxatilis]|uniref:cadherin EGF LAG seven-pass G-type receptor 2-like n=1 Tax=Littorina saxatilis TaxID=31220 RepID=UPI0038B68E9F